MSDPGFSKIAIDGLWKNNPALVQVLGLCPMLAVTGTLVNGWVMGFATTMVLVGSNVTISMVRNIIPREIRIPIFVILIASFVTNVQLLMNAFVYDVYIILGIFIPLIVTNCIIIGRAEAFASRHGIWASFVDAMMQGIGFSAVLMVLGGMREIISQGTLFAGAENVFGEWAKVLKITLFHTDNHFLFAMLPPGAFIGLGLLIALKNYLDQRQLEKEKMTVSEPVKNVELA
ncbi:MAG TPA: electron transport complex subunit E [Aeromonadales bacterium]|nr:electron transport complex subunit E [Aeromonadales bacterium]